ncbi:MAG: hypothetical protein COB04_06615 [Gammaproteobacteria bacterium]|nr:MAG: hypothetical protein COB04_07100 [Gammaproteobacteria bacterium]PCJ18822.1 MAG: hypothetical protein COB04_06615 [Gammaproteobacteria bacterium]
MQLLKDLQEIYSNDRWGARLGIEISDISPESIRLHLPFQQQNMNLGGRMHGGVLASVLVDAAKLLAQSQCLNNAPLNWRVIDYQINYLRAGGPEALEATATVTRRTREFLFCRCEIHTLQDSSPLAVADVLIRIYDPASIPPTTRHQQQPYQGELLTDQSIAENAPNKNMVDMFNQMMSQLYPGSTVYYMEDGHAEMIQDDFPDQYDFQDNISAGQLLLFFDNVSGCSGGSLADGMGIAVTLTIQATFCESARNEKLIGISKVYQREDGLTHNDVKIIGAESKQLKMFGTMTHLARPFKKSS